MFVSKWKKGSVISINSLKGLQYVQTVSIFTTWILILESILGFVQFAKKRRVFLEKMDLLKGTQCVFCEVQTDFFFKLFKLIKLYTVKFVLFLAKYYYSLIPRNLNLNYNCKY